MPRGKKKVEVQPVPVAEPKKRGRKPNPVAAVAEPEKAKRGRKKLSETLEKANPIPVEIKKADDEMPDVYLQEVCKVLGRNIRTNRKLRKFSIDNLADYLDLSSSYVGLLERGERCPSLKTLLKICDLFGIGLPDLFVQQQYQNPSIHERKADPIENKRKSVTSLMHKLSDGELDLVITILKGIRNMQKANGDYTVH